MHAYAGNFDEPTPIETHSHEALEFGIVVTGEEEIHFVDSTVIARPGDMWMVAMWEPHGWRITRCPMTGPAIIFRPEFVHEVMSDLSWLAMFAVPSAQRPRVTTPEMRATVLEMGALMLREIEAQRHEWQLLVRLILAYLLTSLRRDWRPPIISGDGSGSDYSPMARVMPAVALVNAGPSRRVTRGNAAAACSLSPSRFSVVFKSAMGMSFERFCRQTRLAFAAHLLLATDMPVKAIASEADFADASHFHRLFVKHYLSTPSEYRRTRGNSLGGVAFAERPSRPAR